MVIITSIAILIGIGVTVFISHNIANQLGAEPAVAAKALSDMTQVGFIEQISKSMEEINHMSTDCITTKQ